MPSTYPTSHKHARNQSRAVVGLLGVGLLASSLSVLPALAGPGFAPTAQAAAPSGKPSYTVTPNTKVPGKKKVAKAKVHTEMLRAHMVKLEKAGGGTLTLAPGTYKLSNVVYVPSNVTVRLSAGTKLVKTAGSKAMFHLIRPSRAAKSGAVGGYNGESNISFLGAGAGSSTVDLAGREGAMGIVMGHNRNVTVSGIGFANMRNGHFIEMDASTNVVVSGNDFRTARAGTKMSKEAINLDTPDKVTRGFSAKWSKFDGTPNNGVLIESNTFSGLTRAIGTHNFTKARYHNAVTIRSNTFRAHRSDPIRPLYWKDAVITGNVIDGVPQYNKYGIRAAGMVNPTITGNTFANMYAPAAFYLYQSPNKAEYRIQGQARNVLSQANIDALAANTAGRGLTSARIQVDGSAAAGTLAAAQAGGGTIFVWLNGSGPAAPAAPTDITTGNYGNAGGRVIVSWDRPVVGTQPSNYWITVYSDPQGRQLAPRSSALPSNAVQVGPGQPGIRRVMGLITVPDGDYWIRVSAQTPLGVGAVSDPVKVIR